MTTFIQSREELERLLVTMNREGWSIRGLARHFSISRNMVRRILRKHQANRDQGHDILKDSHKNRAVRPSKLDPFVGQINQLLERYPKITGQRVFEEITRLRVIPAVSVSSGNGCVFYGQLQRKPLLSGLRPNPVCRDRWTGVPIPLTLPAPARAR